MFQRLMLVATLVAGPGALWCQNTPGMALTVLQETRLAQQAVTSQEPGAALQHVRQAKSMIAEIRKSAPSSSEPLLVPINAEVETTTTYTPVKPSKHGDLTTARMKKRTSVREVEGDVTTDRLDVTQASAHLDTAEAALEGSDFVAAGSALAAVNNAVVRTKTTGDLPLLKVRENLELARARLMEGNVKASATPLRAAAEGIAAFHATEPAVRAGELDTMRTEFEAASRDAFHGRAADVDRLNLWIKEINDLQRKISGVE
jgi:hypothetical protein